MDIPLYIVAVVAMVFLGTISNSLERIADAIAPRKKDDQ